MCATHFPCPSPVSLPKTSCQTDVMVTSEACFGTGMRAVDRGLAWQAMAEVGRWSSLATLRIYVTEALAELQRLQTPPRVWKSILAEAAEMQALVQ